MIIGVELKSRASRLSLGVSILFAGIAFINLSVGQFIISTFTNPKSSIDITRLESAAISYPSSGLLQAQIAARLIETGAALDESYAQEVDRAVEYASQAVNLSPRNFEYRLLLAEAWEMGGNLARAENEYRIALRLAPGQADLHWRLANFLVREGKLAQAIEEFRCASAALPERTLLALDLLWAETEGNVDAVRSIVGGDVASQMKLALFLIERGRIDDAVSFVQGLDKSEAVDNPLLPQILEKLISANQIEPASRLWRDLFGEDEGSYLWNGSFERPIRRSLAAFDWTLNQNNYAEIGITTSEALTGRRSLKIIYRGIDTTRIENEIRQLIPVTPGERYTLSYGYKSKELSTLEGPKVVVISLKNSVIAQSIALRSGSQDWRSQRLNFVAPTGEHAVFISIQQTPQFSYTAPTKGTVWFDDFVVAKNHIEVGGLK
jgi:tetratricopeptide (TPR) repeat protein